MANLQDAFYRSQQTKYKEVEPNRFLPGSLQGKLGDTAVQDTLDAISAYDPYIKKTRPPFSFEAAKDIFQGTTSEVADLTFCRQYTGLSGLEKLIRDTEDNPNAPLRCGWRYKKSPGGLCPEVCQGALGSKSGPLDTNDPIDALGNGVEWIWDLKEAQKRILVNAASSASTAEALRVITSACGGDFQGKLGYCLITKKMIPILRDGRPMYPNDSMYTCPLDQIITDPSKIPPPSQTNAIANFQQAAFRELASCADTGVNPSLSRDCLLQAIKNNGCSSQGTLYTSLQAVDPNQSQWDSTLKTQPSFQSFQSRQGDNGFTDKLFRKGMSDWNQAVKEVTRLQSLAESSSDRYTRVAAKDLCTARGTFDTYNFCSEISESAPIRSVELTCLQQFWQELNGKPAGALYPKSYTFDPQLGTINTYGDFKSGVQRLKTLTTNMDPVVQRKAMNSFYGVNVSSVVFSPDKLFSMNTPLAFWLDAMDSNNILLDGKNGIKRWRDKSGKGRELVQNEAYARPLYTRSGAYPGIEFQGTNQFIEIPQAFDLVRREFTIFVVEKRKSSKAENYFLGGMALQRNANLVLGYGNERTGLMAFWANDTTAPLPPYKASLEPTRLFTFRKTSGPKEVFIDGGARNASNPNPDPLVDWNGAALGRYYDRFYHGVLYEVLIYTTALDDEARMKVEGYLAHKWAFALPSNHPYKVNPP
jgi:hypothetical protein